MPKHIFTRREIGLRPARGSDGAGKITHCSLHHGGAVGGPRMTFKHAASTWREWQNYHQNVRGWNDIGYNLGVDGLGRLYEGRPIGTLPAAVLEHNSNSIAINFMQDGDRWGLTPLQKRRLRILFKHGEPKLKVPPLKTLVNLPGEHGGVFGHKEYSGHSSNACPGNKIMRFLRRIRKRYVR